MTVFRFYYLRSPKHDNIFKRMLKNLKWRICRLLSIFASSNIFLRILWTKLSLILKEIGFGYHIKRIGNIRFMWHQGKHYIQPFQLVHMRDEHRNTSYIIVLSAHNCFLTFFIEFSKINSIYISETAFFQHWLVKFSNGHMEIPLVSCHRRIGEVVRVVSIDRESKYVIHFRIGGLFKHSLGLVQL